MARIVFAPDSFKGSIGAIAAAEAIAAGWTSLRPDDEAVLCPMADGGEGVLDVLEAAIAGSVRRPVRVLGPDDRPVDASWLLLPDGTGVVELAATSGLALLADRRPLDAHTVGFGQAIAAALGAGAAPLLLAVGGSASTDGGAGLLQALGARLLAALGEPITPGNRGLAALAAVDLAGLRPPPPGTVVLTDVAVPLTGAGGAARVFGPQKGAAGADLAGMDAALAHLAGLLGGEPDAPGAGAAGGAGYALARWGARIVPGAPEIAERIGLPAAIRGADLVITGEGRFDATSLLGKVVGTVRALAAAGGVPVALVAGGIDGGTEGFAAALALADLAGSADAAMADPAAALALAGARLAEAWDG